ncbi:MAG TPA: site-specific DNA-methyltransferase [Dysgonamonadaceae bacterium]|nr:site-specific DNA-methyltransferase [Dysgonamonadaceae bacterium]
MAEQDFIKAGFTVVGTENNENKLLRFLKENYPSVIKDNEIDLQELKAIAGLPIDEKVNGYGLNFVGRNFARAKYAQKTEKELRLNNTLSKNIDTTENLVLKGDNLDSLKILKNHYSGKIKCIYIDPPYNTTSDEFVYPDKFDKEEAEVLGLANLSESEFARMDFSFKTKKSHNGWLAFMYPRLLLARDLLSKDGVIFISIDDNEQANLKLLCDDVFGEENTETYIWNLSDFEESSFTKTASNTVRQEHEYIIAAFKNEKILKRYTEYRFLNRDDFSNPDNDPRGPWMSGNISRNGIKTTTGSKYFKIISPTGNEYTRNWTVSKDEYDELVKDNRIYFSRDGDGVPRIKIFKNEPSNSIQSSIFSGLKTSITGKNQIKELFNDMIMFDFPKPTNLLQRIITLTTDENDIILDFFAGSGTTGHAVMQLNADDGGNRKFILCQIDEPIKEGKPAYKFCIENNLPPVISSITIERLKRAGEKITKDIETENSKTGLFEEDKKQVPDIGFKVFDSVEAPKLKVDDKGQISITENDTDALSRIYNMIFTVGLDEPTQVPEEVVKDCIYKIGNHYYITNSEKITSDDYSNAIKNGRVFIDGWTASLNGTLQNYKEDVKIVF